MNEHIPKPFQWRQLADALLQVLSSGDTHLSPIIPLELSNITRHAIHLFDPEQLLQQYEQDKTLAREVVYAFLNELPGQP